MIGPGLLEYISDDYILWHDGEGADARQRFVDLAKPDRDALITFLNSLLGNTASMH